MGKSRRPSIETVQSWIKRGDGQGKGKSYRPFIKVCDVPSKGRSRMLFGLKSKRINHYLSDLEYIYHLLGEFDPTIVDIREQIALLPWAETLEIAFELGIRHPTYPGTKTPIVMTSDQHFTKIWSGGLREGVLSIKYASDLLSEELYKKSIKKTLNIDREERRKIRVHEKLLIEKIFWERRGIPWLVGTEYDIPLIRAKNLDFLRMNMVAEEFDVLNPILPIYTEMFMDFWTCDRTLLAILQYVAAKLKLKEINHSFALFARSVWLKMLPVDIDTEVMHHFQPLRRLNNKEVMLYAKH